MKPRYRLSHLALQDLEDIGYYIALDNPDAALELIERFFEMFDRLAEHPELGRSREEFPGVRSIIVKPYVIFYRCAKNCIEIIRILHGARDISSFIIE